MGQMCSQPMGDDGHDIAIVSGQSRSTDATELSSGKTQRKNLTSVGRQTSGLVDNDSGPRVHKAAGAPAFGKRASTQWMAKEGSASLVEERMTPLKECTDEMIIAEVKLRNIKLHDRITKELVASKYTYGKILGQGSSASVYEAVHTKSKKKVAIKVTPRRAILRSSTQFGAMRRNSHALAPTTAGDQAERRHQRRRVDGDRARDPPHRPPPVYPQLPRAVRVAAVHLGGDGAD